MAVLKKIKFGTGTATPIAQTVVTAASGSVLSVAGTNTGIDDNDNPSYAVDLNISADGTLVKDTTGQQVVLKVGTVPAAQVSVDETDAGITATDAQAAFKELKTAIDNVDGKAKSYTIVKETTGLDTNVKEQYKLQQTVGETSTFVGEPIKIYKDSSLESVALNGQSLDFTYILADGSESTVGVDVSTFLAESEFKDGLQVSANGEVSAKLGQGLEFGGESGENQSIKVKIDSTSEKDSQSTPADFLTVGANGVKIQGIGAEIDRKIAALDVTTDAAVAGQYVAAIEENNGLVAVKTRANVSEAVLNNYAKGSDATAVAATDTVNQAISKLENQVDAAKTAASTGITTAIEALDHTDTAAAGQVVTAVSTADGIAQPTKANLAGITLGGFNEDTTASGTISSSDTLGAAINKLQNQISAASDDHTVVEEASGNTHVRVSGAQNANGGTTYTISETNIADADDLAAEITRAQNAEGEIADLVGLGGTEGSRTFTPTSNYGGSSANVAANLQALDTALNTLSTKVGDISYSVSGTELIFYGIPQHQAQQGG